MCHYRSGHPKRARSVLLPFANYDAGVSSTKGDSSEIKNGTNGANDAEGILDCILYLLAKCSVDLNMWNEAEEYLLQRAKSDYTLYKKQMKKNAPPQQSQSTGVNTLEAWLKELEGAEMEGDSSPVPNGAAGFHLLGIVCKKTMRMEKAKTYFELSLKLDPMLYESYHELCEMGIALSLGKGSAAVRGDLEHDKVQLDDEGDKDTNGVDPAAIFGVIPEALLHIPITQGGYMKMANDDHDREEEKEDYMQRENDEFLKRARATQAAAGIGASPFSVSNSPIAANGDGDDTMHDFGNHRDTSVGGVAGRLSFGAAMGTTPMNANHNASSSATFNPNARSESAIRGTPGLDDHSGFQGTSLFQGNLSTIRKPGRGMDRPGRRSSTGLPSTALFGSPNLTFVRTPRNMEEEQQVLARARKVAGRRYYEPSPETTPPNRIKTTIVPHSSLKLTRKKTRRRFIGAEYDEKNDSMDQSRDVRFGRTDGEKRFLFDTSMDVTSASIGMDDVKDSAVKTAKLTSKKLPRVKEYDTRDIGKKSEVNTEGNQIPPAVNREDGGVQFVLELLCTFGAAQRLLCAFKCKEAIHILHTLPHSQFQTGWVQHQVGRAYFYSVDYTNAQRALETMQEVEPHRMKGLELLSTALYLLKKEVELSNLAQRCIDFDRMSPETWCVVGNCFSLQKEHKTALTFFRRSIQLDPTFTYAHTLSGHEYVANEDFDHAVASFRNAIRVDERHYNAWNGLGEIYFRQEKYDMAEYHFHKALQINPQGSVIRCNLGQAQHANGKHQIALETLALVDKRNPQAQFQRANILISMDKLLEAMKELEKVRDTAPREASIHFAMGRVLKKLGKPEKAMRCFLTALDLDPKENTMIKSAIDRLDEPDIDEDVSAF
jgi:anaphase-promoting complex subunit 3